jgi:hypothetical protein
MPEAFLNRVFEGTKEQQHQRLYFICCHGLHQSPIEKIGVGVLIEWCRAKNDSSVWPSVAAGMSIWSTGEEQEIVTMLESAIRFLEASPEPEAVLNIFAERVTPMSWSGSRVNVMQPRADAIVKLINHERADISEAARLESAKLIKLIEREKLSERQEDEEREQRFE